MNPLFFLIGCIGTRLALTFLAKNSTQYLPILSIFTGLISIGFMTIYIFGLRKTGLETDGKLIWWNDLRPVHAALYGAFSYMAYQGDPTSWKLLLVDTLIGLFAYIYHYMG